MCHHTGAVDHTIESSTTTNSGTGCWDFLVQDVALYEHGAILGAWGAFRQPCLCFSTAYCILVCWYIVAFRCWVGIIVVLLRQHVHTIRIIQNSTVPNT